jgi:hypothetical protein
MRLVDRYSNIAILWIESLVTAGTAYAGIRLVRICTIGRASSAPCAPCARATGRLASGSVGSQASSLHGCGGGKPLLAQLSSLRSLPGIAASISSVLFR